MNKTRHRYKQHILVRLNFHIARILVLLSNSGCQPELYHVFHGGHFNASWLHHRYLHGSRNSLLAAAILHV